MKKYVREFFRRGLIAAGFGPVILAILYLILHRADAVDTLTVNEVCIGIFSLYVLAFMAGGMNVIYQIEKLPLMVAILIHGGVLYVGYLMTYLLNGWLKTGKTPILIFTVIFILGYLAVWGIIYFTTKKKTRELNEVLKKKQESKSA